MENYFFQSKLHEIFGFQRHLAAAFMFYYILHHSFWIQHLISLHLHLTHLKAITKATMHSTALCAG